MHFQWTSPGGVRNWAKTAKRKGNSMQYFYKIHRWFSYFCILFFVMLCVTGLILMFRMELMGANQVMPMKPGTPVSYDTMWQEMPEGKKAVEAAYPEKSVRAIFAQPESGMMQFRVQDKNNHDRVATMMRMGGERIAWYPEDGSMMETTYGANQKSPWVTKTLRVLHIMHTKLVNTTWGTAALAFVCTLTLISLLSGYFLYGPCMRGSAFGRVAEGPSARKWMDIHKFLGITAGLWAVILTVSGLAILYFASEYRTYVKDAQAAAHETFAAEAKGTTKVGLEDALSAVKEKFPGDYVISVELPSRMLSAYTFYVTRAKENPDTYFGQPVFVKDTDNGGAPDIYTKDIPAHIRVASVGVDLHIHNHDLPLLKYLWALWTVLSIVMGVSAFISLWHKKFPEARKAGVRPAHHSLRRGTSPWQVPAVVSLLTLLGLVLPLFGNAAAWGAAVAFLLAGGISFFCWRKESKAE